MSQRRELFQSDDEYRHFTWCADEMRQDWDHRLKSLRTTAVPITAIAAPISIAPRARIGRRASEKTSRETNPGKDVTIATAEVTTEGVSEIPAIQKNEKSENKPQREPRTADSKRKGSKVVEKYTIFFIIKKVYHTIFPDKRVCLRRLYWHVTGILCDFLALFASEKGRQLAPEGRS